MTKSPAEKPMRNGRVKFLTGKWHSCHQPTASICWRSTR